MKRIVLLVFLVGGLIDTRTLAQTMVWSYQFKTDGVDLEDWAILADGSGGCVLFAHTIIKPDRNNSDTWVHNKGVLWLDSKGHAVYNNFDTSLGQSLQYDFILLSANKRAIIYNMCCFSDGSSLVQ